MTKVQSYYSSSISRELKRNTGLKGYQAKHAQGLILHRRVTSYKSIKITHEVKCWVDDLPYQDFAYEQIAGR